MIWVVFFARYISEWGDSSTVEPCNIVGISVVFYTTVYRICRLLLEYRIIHRVVSSFFCQKSVFGKLGCRASESFSSLERQKR